MGLCVSRRAMHDATSDHPRKDEGAAPELKRSSSEMINPARLLLESPRISSDISDMGMLGLLFHKRYCCKPLDSPNNKPNSAGYQKLKAEGSPSPAITKENEGDKPGMVIQENVLFEEQQQRREEEAEDGYPTFEPNSQAQQPGDLRGKDEGGVARVWQSAGEEFYSEWEDRLRGKDQLQLHHRAQESREIGVFGAEDYFKERGENEQQPKLEHQQQVHATSVSSGSSSSSATAASLSSSSSSACSSSGSGMKWATLCAGASAVEVDEPPQGTSPAGTSKKNKSKPAKSEILHISKMFKLLASPSSSPSTRSSFSHKHKKARTSEHHHHHHQPEPEADPAETSGEVKVGFGSPFPSSSNLAEGGDEPATATAPVRAEEQQETGEQNEGNEGNESDSSSDLFELDSVATSLSSARSSLSRLSSARSSVRKSTVDEADILHFISDSSSKQPPVQRQQQAELQPASTSNSEDSSLNASSSSASLSSSSSSSGVVSSSTSSSANVALLIMKGNRRHTSRVPLLEPGPLLSILEENKPPASGGQRRVAKQLNSWNSIAVQT